MNTAEKIVYLFPGVHPLYDVSAFVCGIIMLIMISRILVTSKTTGDKRPPHFQLFLWVLFFCAQDGVWGLFASHAIPSDTGLFITSAVFHISSSVTPFVWTIFHTREYPGRQRILMCTGLMTLVETGMVISNFFTKAMFYVDEAGEYCSTPVRRLLFYLQFAVYLFIGFLSLYRLITNGKGNRKERQNILALLCMNTAPIAFGVFQMLYPDAPANSMGFTIACVIFYTFIEADNERQLTELKTRESFTEIIEGQNDQLRVSQQLLEQALQSAESANSAKTSFLFNMSHDIRTPMNAIVGFTAMAKKHAEDPEATRTYLDKIDTAGKQLLALINQVLEMSRIESGKVTLQNGPTDLHERVRILRTIYEEIARAKGITLDIAERNLVHSNVVTDSDRINQILTNLIGNAIKYTPEGGTVRLTVEEAPGSADGRGFYTFTVEDNGIGMSSEFVEHIFDEFSREESSTVNRIQGTGLGMSIVKKLTDLLGGTIEVFSEKGKGTRMVFSLEMPFGEETSVRAGDAPEEDPVTVKGLRVLLVDDNEMNREIGVEILEDVGMIVETACDGREAVQKVTGGSNGKEGYDCVLMDIQMPVMDGYEAVKAIRAAENGESHLPVIALSANAFAEDRQRSLDAGMDEHLAKPIIIGELISMLSRFPR